MAQLLNCLECGSQVSSEARTCPQCATRYPLGRECAACLKIAKASAGLDTRNGDVRNWIDTGCYEEFQREYQSVRFTCPVCGNIEQCQTVLEDSFVVPFFSNWSKCGHPVDPQYSTSKCIQCSAPVIGILNAGTWGYPVHNPLHRKCEVSRQILAQRKAAKETKSGCLTILVFALSLPLLLILCAVVWAYETVA